MADDRKIETILDARQREGKIQFKVQWSGTGNISWEQEHDLTSPKNLKILEKYKLHHKRKLATIAKKIEAARQTELDEEDNSSSDDGTLRPRALDIEELVEGMDKATARARKQLHDDTHIYTLTEQLLFKSDFTDSGHVTRSKMRDILAEVSPTSAACLNERHDSFPVSELQIKQEIQETDSHNETPAEISGLKSGNGSELTPVRGRGRGPGRPKGRSKGYVSTPRMGIPVNKLDNLPKHRNSMQAREIRGARKSCPRRLTFDDVCGESNAELSKDQRSESGGNNQADASESSLSSEILLPQTPPELPQLIANTSPLPIEAGDVPLKKLIFRSSDNVQLCNEEFSHQPFENPPASNKNKRPLLRVREEEPEKNSDVERLIKMKTKSRRRLMEFLPGPITKITIKESVGRVELHEAVSARFTPDYSDFNVYKMLEAVLVGDYSRFRAATEFFVSRDGQVIIDEISSAVSNWRDDNGGTLIHMVCRSIRCNEKHAGDDLVFVLAKYAPELLVIRDKSLQIPLHIAVQRGELCRVSKLLTLGSPVTWRDAHSLSPLDIAYNKGGINMVKMMLNAGATFHELLSHEEKSTSSNRKPPYNILLKHCGILNGLMRRARKKILRNIRDVFVLSPIFMAPIKDSLEPVFRFSYIPSPAHGIDCMQLPMLFIYIAVNRLTQGKRGVEWSFRCHGPMNCYAPKLNGKEMKPMCGNATVAATTTDLLTNTFVFFCPLKSGTNVITFRLHESYESSPLLLSAQVLMMKKNHANPFSRGVVFSHRA